MGEQSLQFGGEEQGAVGQLGIEKRLHAEPVASEEQQILIGIVEREGEHAVQPGERMRPPLPPGGEDHLGVALGEEDVTLGFELGPDLAEIVDLAIEADRDPPVGRQHRLRGGVGEVDDREAAMAEADPGRGPDAAAVGTAMGEHLRHRLDPSRIDRLGHVGMEDAGDAAH